MKPGKDVFNDLCMRFVLNCPEEELQSWERLLFQVEQAHWFYEDHIRRENTKLETYKLKSFAKTLFSECSVLKPYKEQVDEIMSQFNAYKSLVPVMGGIILDKEMEHCLLLRGIKSSGTWGFPKGKLDQNEEDIHCAAREVLEETSLDISDMVSEENSIEINVKNQRRKMYIVSGVDRNTLFAPKMRGEVGKYAWMPISGLPSKGNNEGAGVMTQDDGRFKFWQVWRFVKPLRAWIKRQKQKSKEKSKLVVLKGKVPKKKEPATVTIAATTTTSSSSPASKKDTPPPTPPSGDDPLLDFTFDKESIMNAFSLVAEA
ncbi:subunit 2 of mRNA decapping complex [Chloropicon primus]|uniref:Subunit 2 of mRNA decapping complex n=2 Tax=Chloropicon primus TaxID=1764295 RepID=A0A5B8MI20_9CHLO|nr:subunit 2 of mRNA decapping complex [Chloropicon primus]UPQ99311.1 subunit 2 of mRNA decapping complex [Chloropicon primus]|eukprot:QDZ20099.1 subunit 2 of mRNA decapping complex [Chloropicon primus]